MSQDRQLFSQMPVTLGSICGDVPDLLTEVGRAIGDRVAGGTKSQLESYKVKDGEAWAGNSFKTYSSSRSESGKTFDTLCEDVTLTRNLLEKQLGELKIDSDLTDVESFEKASKQLTSILGQINTLKSSHSTLVTHIRTNADTCFKDQLLKEPKINPLDGLHARLESVQKILAERCANYHAVLNLYDHPVEGPEEREEDAEDDTIITTTTKKQPKEKSKKPKATTGYIQLIDRQKTLSDDLENLLLIADPEVPVSSASKVASSSSESSTTATSSSSSTSSTSTSTTSSVAQDSGETFPFANQITRLKLLKKNLLIDNATKQEETKPLESKRKVLLALSQQISKDSHPHANSLAEVINHYIIVIGEQLKVVNERINQYVNYSNSIALLDTALNTLEDQYEEFHAAWRGAKDIYHQKKDTLVHVEGLKQKEFAFVQQLAIVDAHTQKLQECQEALNQPKKAESASKSVQPLPLNTPPSSASSSASVSKAISSSLIIDETGILQYLTEQYQKAKSAEINVDMTLVERDRKNLFSELVTYVKEKNPGLLQGFVVVIPLQPAALSKPTATVKFSSSPSSSSPSPLPSSSTETTPSAAPLPSFLPPLPSREPPQHKKPGGCRKDRKENKENKEKEKQNRKQPVEKQHRLLDPESKPKPSKDALLKAGICNYFYSELRSGKQDIRFGEKRYIPTAIDKNKPESHVLPHYAGLIVTNLNLDLTSNATSKKTLTDLEHCSETALQNRGFFRKVKTHSYYHGVHGDATLLQRVIADPIAAIERTQAIKPLSASTVAKATTAMKQKNEDPIKLYQEAKEALFRKKPKKMQPLGYRDIMLDNCATFVALTNTDVTESLKAIRNEIIQFAKTNRFGVLIGETVTNGSERLNVPKSVAKIYHMIERGFDPSNITDRKEELAFINVLQFARDYADNDHCGRSKITQTFLQRVGYGFEFVEEKKPVLISKQQPEF